MLTVFSCCVDLCTTVAKIMCNYADKKKQFLLAIIGFDLVFFAFYVFLNSVQFVFMCLCFLFIIVRSFSV